MSTMSGESADLNTKYQKLATEYAKLRSQVVVLKKGVIDEQEKNTSLSDQLHEKETQLRKHESEMEGVLFRNQQLSRRVNVLQDEIDGLQSKSHKQKWRGGQEEKELAERVINEELVAKITENARLHATLDDIEKQYENTIQTLQSRIQELEKDKSEMGNAKRNKELEISESMAQANSENADLRLRVSLLERDLALRSKQNESLEVQVTVLTEKNRSLESVSRSDFSAQFEFVDPEVRRQQEEQSRKIDSLQHRLTECLEKLGEAEKDREHWKLETQLVQIKLQKQAANSGDTASQVPEKEPTADRNPAEIKALYDKRIGELMKDRIEADSKATAFYLECEAQMFKVAHLEEELKDVSDELTIKRDMLVKGEEEIRTMQLNYEEQLSVMSDHLAEMNSKLATQEDTIVHLRQVQSPDGKKKKK